MDCSRIERRKRKRRGSDGTQAGSDGTHGGSDGTQATHDGPVRDGDAEEFDLAARFMEPSEGWWTSYGFKSLGEYLRYSQTGPDRPGWLGPPRKKKDLAAPDLPAGEMPSRRNGGPLARNRQISIRLDEEGYQDLVKVARLYRVPPATMGRLLVAKGARKALESG